jgi:hypothetical protein
LITLAQKTFTMYDQRRFAAASGDHNPIHIDQLAARRTQAGAAVVHGINLLLWSLDAFAAARPNLPPLSGLRALFKRLVYLDEPACVVADNVDAAGARLCVVVEGGLKSEFALEFGVAIDVAPGWSTAPLEIPSYLQEAWDLSFEQISKISGRLPFRMTAEDASTCYPAAAKWLGTTLIQGLAATSHLVGMICPGLHSLYSELSIKSCILSERSEGGIAFRVTKTNPRYAIVTEEVTGANFTGTVKTFLRTPPVTQATMQSLAGVVARDEFAGSLALVVGGSRGLGELTAKLIATGGGRVLITWQSGKSDALRVAEEIGLGGGHCETLHFDAREAAEAQLASLAQAPSHAYYFATPQISRPRSDIYVARRFDEFLSVYVDGFWRLTQALRTRMPTISIFYPSSIFVTERPPGMTEYAMAKAAGESLCADVNAQLAPTRVTVKRLPRLPTDQTASLTAVKMENPLDVMLPIVREVQLGLGY